MANPHKTPLKEIFKGKKISKLLSGTNNPRKLDFPQKAIADNIIFSKTEAWAFYRMSSAQFDFESIDAKSALMRQASEAYTSILSATKGTEPIEIMPFSMAHKISPDAFLSTSFQESQNQVNPMYATRMVAEAQIVKELGFVRRESYIGVNLGSRKKLQKSRSDEDFSDGAKKETLEDARKLFTEGALEALSSFQDYARVLLGIQTEELSETEEHNARAKENQIRMVLMGSALKCEPLTRGEILLVTKSMFHPLDPVPPLKFDEKSVVGSADIAYEYSHLIDSSDPSCLKITQENDGKTSVAYMATYTVTNLPEVLEFPQMTPFAEVAISEIPTARIFARLTILPHQMMGNFFEGASQKDVNEAKDFKDANQEIQEFGHKKVEDLKKAHERLKWFQAKHAEVRAPWVQGSIHVCVASREKDELKRYFYQLQQAYSHQNVELAEMTCEQMELLMMGIPGSGLFIDHKGYNHVVSQQFGGYLGLNFASSVGDDINMSSVRTKKLSDLEEKVGFRRNGI